MQIPEIARQAYKEAEGKFCSLFINILRNKGYGEKTIQHLHAALVLEEFPVSEPVKRTIIVVLEIEVEEQEDTFQTAELAVELLNGDMDNQVTLIAAAEKQ